MLPTDNDESYPSTLIEEMLETHVAFKSPSFFATIFGDVCEPIDANVHVRGGICLIFCPPGSEASREVLDFFFQLNLLTPVYGVKEFVRLSVTKFDPNYLRTGKTDVGACPVSRLELKLLDF